MQYLDREPSIGKNELCIVCGSLFVSLCPNCFKPLCMQHGAQAEKRRIRGDEFCRGQKKASGYSDNIKRANW